MIGWVIGIILGLVILVIIIRQINQAKYSESTSNTLKTIRRRFDEVCKKMKLAGC